MGLTIMGVLLVAAGLVFNAAPEWLREQYVKGAKGRREQPMRRVDWQAREQRIGLAFMAVGVVMLVAGVLLDGLIFDLVAAVIFFGLAAWRMFTLIGG